MELADALGGGGVVLAERLLEPLERRAQLELAERLAQPRAVRLACGDVLEVDVGDVDVAHRCCELLRDARVLGVLGEVLLALGARDRVDVAEHALERAPFLQKLRGGFLADAGDARDVVRGVALEAHEVWNLLGRDPVAVDHRVAVVDLRVGDPAPGRHHTHSRLDQLEQVAVPRHHHHVESALARLAGQRRDHVVRLVARHLDVLVSERVHERVHVGPLLGEQIGAFAAARLVLVIDLLAARHTGVPDDQRRVRPVLRDDLHEHRGEAEDRVRWLPLGGRDRLGQREERAVDEAVAVDQEELRGGWSAARLSPYRRAGRSAGASACESLARSGAPGSRQPCGRRALLDGQHLPVGMARHGRRLRAEQPVAQERPRLRPRDPRGERDEVARCQPTRPRSPAPSAARAPRSALADLLAQRVEHRRRRRRRRSG